MKSATYERRDYNVEKIELRDTDEGQVISGMALPFNRDSQDLGGFVERIDPGAVDRTLENSDGASDSHSVGHRPERDFTSNVASV